MLAQSRIREYLCAARFVLVIAAVATAGCKDKTPARCKRIAAITDTCNPTGKMPTPIRDALLEFCSIYTEMAIAPDDPSMNGGAERALRCAAAAADCTTQQKCFDAGKCSMITTGPNQPFQFQCVGF